MKKLILILLSLISIAYAQVGRFPYQTIQQTYKGDTVSTTIKGDSVAFTSSESKFSFNKDVYVKGTKLGGTPTLTLDSLTDVSDATPTASNFLMANGTNWSSVSFADSVAAYAGSVTNKIPTYYVSESGTNCPTCGSRENPFRSPEYAVGIIDVADSITMTTSIGSATCTDISDADYALLKVGMPISSAIITIPYGTVIISLNGGGVDAKSITLSNTMLNNGIISSIAVWRPAEIEVYGNHTVVSNLARDGVVWDFTESSIVWGDLTLFNVTAALKNDFKVVGGTFNGTHANSVFLYSGLNQNISNFFIVKPEKITSKTTTYLIQSLGGTGFNANIESKYIKSSLGGLFYDGGGSTYEATYRVVYSYCLMAYSILVETNFFRFEGRLESPASVNTFKTNTPYLYFRGTLCGNFYIEGFTYAEVFGAVQGSSTNYVLGSGQFKYDVYQTQGTLNFFSGNMTAFLSGYQAGNVVVSNGVIATIDSYMFFISASLTMNATSNPKQTNFNNYRYQYAMSVFVNGGTFNNYAYITGGDAFVQLLASTAYVNNYRTISSSSTSAVYIADGVYTDNNSMTESTFNNATARVIYKAGGWYVSNNGTLKMAYAASPIYCSANTTASKQVVYRGLTTNCDGSTYGALFLNGAGYAPVPVINNNLNESTTYTW